MLIKYHGSRKYRDEAGEGGDAGAAAAAQVAAIAAAVDKATSGLKATNAALKAEKTAALEAARKFEGLDVDELTALHAQFKDSKDMQDLKDGKIDEVLARRNEKFLKDTEKRVTEATATAAAFEARNKKFADRVLNDSIRAAAINAGVHKHAVDDALLAARLDFTLDEDGNPVQMRDGEIVLGKDGKTPFSPDEWFATKSETKPHWFPADASGSQGPSGRSAGSSGGKTMRRAAFDSLPIAERAKVAGTHRIID